MINELIKYATTKNIKLEVYENNKKIWSLEIFNNKIIKYNISDDTSYKIKSLYKNKNIIIKTNDITPKEKIINTIYNNYELSDNTNLSDFALPIEIKSKIKKEIKIDYSDISKYLVSLNKLKNNYPKLKTINSSLLYEKNNISIYNEKVELKDSISSINISFELIVKEGKNIETKYFNIYTNEFNKEIIKKELIRNIEDTINRLNAIRVESKNTKILIENESMFSILTAFGNMFFSKPIRLKTSVLTNKFGKKVFNRKISIIEDPTNEDMIENRLFDDEGVKTYYKEIIKNGVFIQKLYNNEEANIEGVKSTGNSFGVNNMYIKPGSKSLEELIEFMQDGVMITSICGLHSGINIVTGDFSVQCEGYKIINGKKAGSIKLFVMTSNIIELLNNVIEVGKDLKIFNSLGGSPSIIFNNIDIVG